MIGEQTGTIPKRGDHVGSFDRQGTYEVVDVNMLMQTANLKSMDGNGHITRDVPWASLTYNGKKH